MYSDTCINRSCSTTETLFRRTDMFDLVRFLYASLYTSLKWKPYGGHYLRQTTFFHSSDKKTTCLTRTQRKIWGTPRNSELNWTFLSTFSKKKTFFTLFKRFLKFSIHFLQQWFFFISFYSFEGVWHFWVELCIIFYKLPSATKQ